LLEDATVIRRYDRAKFAPNGLAGGKPGRASRFVIRLGQPQETVTPASGRFEMKAGEKFLLESAGGGGYGDPRKRDRETLARDQAEGTLTLEAVRRDYDTN
jgi:N-methylhydantoinase B